MYVLVSIAVNELNIVPILIVLVRWFDSVLML